MKINDKLKKVGNVVISTTSRAVKKAIADERARNEAQKMVWKDVGDGKRAKTAESYAGFTPAIIWVIGDKVYATDVYRADTVEITGGDAEVFRSSSEGAAAIKKQSRSGFGSASHMDSQMPDYLIGAPHKKAQTYEEWMGLK